MEEANYRWPTLIEKYLSGKITPEEFTELERLALTSPIKQRQFKEITDFDEFTNQMQELQHIDTDEAWEKIRLSVGDQKEKVRGKQFQVKKKVTRLAQIVTVALVATVVVILLLPSYSAPSVKDHNYTKVIGKEYRLDPGTAFHLLRNGSSINFQDSFISFANNAYQKCDDPELNTIVVVTTNGRVMKVILPDSSIVRLNTASAITFPLHFGKTDRKLKVYGEAYFEVSSLNNKPFIVSVKNKNIDIIAIGTSFNITNYEDEEVKTTLFEGNIIIKRGKKEYALTAGQEAIAIKKDDISINRTPNINKTKAWTNNRFNFENATINEIVTELARWYNLEVDYRGDTSGTRYDCQFPRSTDIQDIIQVLNTQNKIQITKEGKRLIVTNDISKKHVFNFMN